MKRDRMERWLSRNIGNLMSPGGRRARLAVFGYHQVLQAPDPYRLGEPDLSEFSSDIDIIASVFNVLDLNDAARCLAEGNLPARAACITFDDGYANNHSLAAPVLEGKGVPATFFITAGAVDSGVMWNDLVIEAVIHAGSDADTGPVAGFDRDRRSVRDDKGLMYEIIDFLKYRPLEERLNSAREFYARNVGSDQPRLMMTREQVLDLSRRGFDIGGHTVHHPILAGLDEEDARSEIMGCSAWLSEITGRPPTTFAYPNGIPGKDFDGSHEVMVANAGFEVAVSTRWGFSRPGENLFRLPRLGPWWRTGSQLATGMARGCLRSYL